jgi:hypothetical protein
MPSVSKKQHNFMAAVANNPAFAKKAGVPQSVGKEFNEADKGRKFSKGGGMKKMNMGGYADGGMPMVNKGGKMVPEFAADGKGKMAKGGMAKEDMKQDKSMMQKAVNKHEGRLHKGATMTKLASGGSAKYMSFNSSGKPSGMKAVKSSSSRDGVATKGKTKGTMITMKRGGKC